MQNNIQQFENQEFGKVRVLQRDGQSWFVGKDVTEALGYGNSRAALAKHVDDEDKDVTKCDTPGGEQRVAIINESGLYCLILSSKLPTAKAFKRWVTSEILPTIRQHGAYITRDTLERMQEDSDFAAELLERLAAEHAKNRALTNYVEKLQPKAQYYDNVLQSDSAIPVTLIAKSYGVTAQAFNRLLHALEIQYRLGSTWYLYKEYADKGYTTTKTYYVGKKRVSVHTAWTQLGRAFLYELLAWYGIKPKAEALKEAA